MKIRTKSSEKIITVYAMYSINGETYFLGHSKGYNGLLAYNAREIEVIDPDLSGDFTYFGNDGYGVYYSALIKEKLLDDLLEGDETAYKRFLEILKAEGRLDPDFY
ncbi:hypothetical protein [Rosenbergiella australiborealis]|uniref:hypothetical protein n=1 Tax=Rosenbergiella australiborealis TaxID=1544696 RepID=UPI001F4DE260|nr:hypothetical protein [Rosenbergiella australiborealis]